MPGLSSLKSSVELSPPQGVPTYSPHDPSPYSHLPGRHPKTTSHLGSSTCCGDASAWPKCNRCRGSRPFAIVGVVLSVTYSPSLRTRSVNKVVPRGKAVETAISWALKICENSPDAVQATKHGLMLGLLRGGVDEAFTSHVWGEASKKVWAGENIKVSCIRNDAGSERLPHV